MCGKSELWAASAFLCDVPILCEDLCSINSQTGKAGPRARVLSFGYCLLEELPSCWPGTLRLQASPGRCGSPAVARSQSCTHRHVLRPLPHSPGGWPCHPHGPTERGGSLRSHAQCASFPQGSEGWGPMLTWCRPRRGAGAPGAGPCCGWCVASRAGWETGFVLGSGWWERGLSTQLSSAKHRSDRAAPLLKVKYLSWLPGALELAQHVAHQ